MVSRLSPRAHRAGPTKQPGPQARTWIALAEPTSTQREAFDLLDTAIPLTLK